MHATVWTFFTKLANCLY